MKKVCFTLALAGLFLVRKSSAISLDDIQLWTGSGTNRAALVIEWNTPEIFNFTTVPAPVANKTMVWGYRFNGSATGTQMFNAIMAANPRLYAVENIDPTYGTGVDAIGFSLNGSKIAGVTDGTNTDLAGSFNNGVLIDPRLGVDTTYSLNSGDLFWSGHYGPYWQLWTELGDSGGFTNSPNRGSSAYWDPDSYAQGQWASAYYGLDYLPITDGSWLGFSVSADGYDTNEPALDVFNNDEQAPPSPDGTYVAYVCNTNDFAVEIISTNNVDPASPYNDPDAILNRPTLQFYDPADGHVTNRVSIIDPPYNVTPAGANVITEIGTGGQITVDMGRKIYDDPNNPYGIDLIVYGNSFFEAFGFSGVVGDGTDLNAVTLSSSPGGHMNIVSVSQDGMNWYTFTNAAIAFPDEAYRWDDTNDSWTDEEMNPTKPLNPSVPAMNFGGLTVAGALDQFTGAAGGTGYALKASGLPWNQYVRIQAESTGNQYTVIDAIAAVNPAVVGDVLSITPDNLTAGITNLVFQNRAVSGHGLITINFDSLSGSAKIYTVGLNEFSAFAPVTGKVSSAYQITLKPMMGTETVNYVADVGLRPGAGYNGNGSDLRVYQWGGTNWSSQPFNFNPTNDEVLVAGVTNLSAFVVAQMPPPQLNLQVIPKGFAFQFTPVSNGSGTLERSTDFITWTAVSTFTATNAESMTLQDTNVPAGQAFYRLLFNP